MRTKWEEQHHFYMFLQEKKGSRLEAHQTQIPHVRPWKYSEMGGELLENPLPSGQLDVCQSHAYPKYSQRASHQAIMFCSDLHSG